MQGVPQLSDAKKRKILSHFYNQKKGKKSKEKSTSHSTKQKRKSKHKKYASHRTVKSNKFRFNTDVIKKNPPLFNINKYVTKKNKRNQQYNWNDPWYNWNDPRYKYDGNYNYNDPWYNYNWNYFQDIVTGKQIGRAHV